VPRVIFDRLWKASLELESYQKWTDRGYEMLMDHLLVLLALAGSLTAAMVILFGFGGES
jgi:hypothetical protein